MSNLVVNPFPIFTDTDGLPLEDGFIFIGEAGLSPISNPLQAYWDAELSIPANDIRTKGGYPANSGTPGRIYTGVNYSIVVQDKRGATLYTQNNAIDFFSGAAEVAVQGVAGEVISANDVVYFASDGLLYIADSSDITKSIVAGVSVADVLSGAFVTAQRSGLLSTFSGLTVGSSYYLGNSGTLVLKSALTFADAVVFIGVATTLSTLDLNVQVVVGSDVIALKAKFEVTLSNYNNDSAPVVKEGSVFENNGSSINVSSDATPTGYSSISNSTIFYLYWDDSLLVFIYAETTPIWSDLLQGWYNGNDRALFSLYKDSGGTLYQAKTKELGIVKFKKDYTASGITNGSLFATLSAWIPNNPRHLSCTGQISVGGTKGYIQGVTRSSGTAMLITLASKTGGLLATYALTSGSGSDSIIIDIRSNYDEMV